ncbi:histidine kinase N-terminal 7TM domain-containing protein [Leptospira sp. WS92.C1]
MNLNMLFTMFAGILHFFFGVYVFRLKPRQKAQKIFFLLSLLLSLWLFIQAFRGLLPPEYRNLALNLNFLPMCFLPVVLYLLFSTIEDIKKKTPLWISAIGVIGLAYFTYACIFQKMASLEDPVSFGYEFNLNHHLLVLYSLFWLILTVPSLMKKMLIKRGDFKVRLFLILVGAFLAVPGTIVFSYILPFLGIYKAYLSSIGLAIGSILWAVAILHYDAFKIKAGVIEGADMSLINRAASGGFLKLMEKLDPMRFIQKSSKAKAELTKQILIQDYNLASNTGEFSVEKRAKMLSQKFGKYFR